MSLGSHLSPVRQHQFSVHSSNNSTISSSTSKQYQYNPSTTYCCHQRRNQSARGSPTEKYQSCQRAYSTLAPHLRAPAYSQHDQGEQDQTNHFQSDNIYHKHDNHHHRLVDRRRRSSNPCNADQMMRAPSLYRPNHPAHDTLNKPIPSLPPPGGQRMALKLAQKPPDSARHHWPPASVYPGNQTECGALCNAPECQLESDCSCGDSNECLNRAGLDSHSQPLLQGDQEPLRGHLSLGPNEDCAFMNHRTFHRPLMPHSSVPPLSSAPAALIEQNTYKATPETVTDSHPLRQSEPKHDSDNANNYRTIDMAPDQSPKKPASSSNKHRDKQRQTVSFRRSDTVSQQAVGQKHHNSDRHIEQVDTIRPDSTNGGRVSQTNSSNANQENQPSDPASRHACPASPIVVNHNHLQHYPATGPAPFGGAGASYPPSSPIPPALRAGQMLASNSFVGPCSVPAISSHRTNSPWMRISSIILTPIGIVIILFIVVSPLLHYLM